MLLFLWQYQITGSLIFKCSFKGICPSLWCLFFIKLGTVDILRILHKSPIMRFSLHWCRIVQERIAVHWRLDSFFFHLPTVICLYSRFMTSYGCSYICYFSNTPPHSRLEVKTVSYVTLWVWWSPSLVSESMSGENSRTLVLTQCSAHFFLFF